MTPRPARLGIDVGTVRIGIALCPAGVDLAVPVETVPRGSGDLRRIREIVAQHRVEQVFVGDPIRLSGAIGPAAREARAFAQTLADTIPLVRVFLVDERLTTAESSKQMRSAGRNTRKARSVIDQAAAVVILQNAMNTGDATGTHGGTLLKPQEDNDE